MPGEPIGQSITLSPKDYGVNPVPLIEQWVDIKSTDGRLIKLKTATWKRTESPSAIKDNEVTPIPYQQENQAVFLSGFGSRGQDLPIGFEALGQFYDTVVALDHPDAPTSKILPHDRPLNENDFSNSGYVILRGIEAKIKDGTLKAGVSAAGLSTGAPVLLEAVAQDIRESAETGRPRYIKSLLLMAPAGMQEHASFEAITAGVASSTKPYLEKNYLRDLYFRTFGKLNKNISENNDRKTKTSFNELCQRIKTAWNNPEWKDIRSAHIGFELFEFAAQRLPVDDFMATFHRFWPNQDPHFLPTTPSVKRNQELIFRNITQKARETIHDTDIHIELYDGDKAVSPDGFLTANDKRQIDKLTLDDNDLNELKQLNERRIKLRTEQNAKLTVDHKPTLPDLTPYSDEWMLKNKKSEIMLSRTIQRVKALFPNNGDHTHVSINIGGNHLTPKADFDMTMAALSHNRNS
jgi:hypothetical protein